jgi:hypothetical protein
MLPVGLLLLGFLVAGSSEGSLRVKTDVAEVKVILDGQEVGQTPVTVTPVPAGRHRVTLMKAGYEDHVEEVEVQPGATARMFVVMKRSALPLPPLPASYRALHQHRAGACLGNLTVTAEAVDYRSDDGKDVFHIPIRDIRSVARGMGSLLNHAGRSTADGTGCRLEAAQTAWPFDSELRRHDQRLKFCRGRGVAKVALARKLAVRLYGRRREAVAPRPPARESCGVS